MVIPGVGVIEEAADSLTRVAQSIREWQRKQLGSFGASRAQSIGASGLSEDFQVGYELGLETARVLLSGSPAAVMAKVSL